MASLETLGTAIDAATDAADEDALRKLCEHCDTRLESATGEERVALHYYQANTYSGIIEARAHDADYMWSWDQPDGVQNLICLRRAISEPAFDKIDQIIACQIRTNLANQLSTLGRPVAANEQWLKVLDSIPQFAKALAARGQGLEFYAGTLYDPSHTSILLASARCMFDQASDKEALWESGDRDFYAPNVTEKRKCVADHLSRVLYDEDCDLNQWSLGETERERTYREWCLRERLFLNPLNDAYTVSVAATDVLHLPSHTYRIGDAPRFPAYYNLMKQEYISARYRLYVRFTMMILISSCMTC